MECDSRLIMRRQQPDPSPTAKTNMKTSDPKTQNSDPTEIRTQSKRGTSPKKGKGHGRQLLVRHFKNVWHRRAERQAKASAVSTSKKQLLMGVRGK